MTEARRSSRIAVAVAVFEPVWLLTMIAGMYGAGFGWRPGAYLMLAAVLGTIGGHVVAGAAEYRTVMARPWPQVAPLADEDDW